MKVTKFLFSKTLHVIYQNKTDWYLAAISILTPSVINLLTLSISIWLAESVILEIIIRNILALVDSNTVNSQQQSWKFVSPRQ